jgi:hypothetical protein
MVTVLSSKALEATDRSGGPASALPRQYLLPGAGTRLRDRGHDRRGGLPTFDLPSGERARVKGARCQAGNRSRLLRLPVYRCRNLGVYRQRGWPSRAICKYSGAEAALRQRGQPSAVRASRRRPTKYCSLFGLASGVSIAAVSSAEGQAAPLWAASNPAQ